MLTEGPKRPELQPGAVGDEYRRRGQGGARGQGGVVVFRASGSCGSAREAPAGMLEGSGWPEGRRRRAIAQKSGNSPAAVRCDSGTVVARIGASELGVNPGLRADLWWGSAGAVARQGVVAVAAPACGAAEQGAAEQSGVGVAARVGWSRGVRGRYLKGGGVPLACAPGFGTPASAPGIAGGRCGRRKATLTCGPDGAASGSGRTLAGGPVRGDAG